MPKLEVQCDGCDTVLLRYPSEINRRGGGTFCSRSCSATAGNAPRRSKEIVMNCSCGKRFKTTTRNKAASHCSRSCASTYSMSPERREAQRAAGLAAVKNLIPPEETLRRREAWKYVALKETLNRDDRPHQFEFKLGCYVYDLALIEEKILVEFDGPDHRRPTQTKDDAKKAKAAEKKGWMVIRRTVLPTSVIDPTTLAGI